MNHLLFFFSSRNFKENEKFLEKFAASATSVINELLAVAIVTHEFKKIDYLVAFYFNSLKYCFKKLNINDIDVYVAIYFMGVSRVFSYKKDSVKLINDNMSLVEKIFSSKINEKLLIEIDDDLSMHIVI